ncbi:TetR/AcrR family transcriptional regulator [Streptomyces noursei]|uniref:TetR/AcrR family transcriptional regulator n=1 Tax=Streptomyces noursei TaxID=1971 RepID=UPI001677B8D7|nr:TetR/AcrR family transcriptional regulator [Streptomyces noursei]MCZ1013160.1 TetR/AcrR family transcriptional regulator [Streptomyces noursei]GGX27379.1 TetR family transcriptional regulator [Streptomyces noursei]
MGERTESNQTAAAGRRPARGRPRDAERDRALLEATVQVLQENGYGGLTTAAVAKRAGVSTATLYRRWRSKEDLVVGTAVRWASDLGPQPDTGSLEGDLAALLRDKADTLEGPGGRLLHVLIGESAHNEALARVLDTAIIEPVRDRSATVVRRAVDRGDIPSLENPQVLADLVVGSMVSRLFLTPDAAHRSATDGPSSGEAAIRELLPFLLRALGAQRG